MHLKDCFNYESNLTSTLLKCDQNFNNDEGVLFMKKKINTYIYFLYNLRREIFRKGISTSVKIGLFVRGIQEKCPLLCNILVNCI